MIELTEQGGVAVMRLDDGKANTMSLEFCEAVTARFADLSSSRAVVLTATGHIFSAGVDLLRLSEGGAPYVHKFLPALRAMFAAVFSHAAPVVAARARMDSGTSQIRSVLSAPTEPMLT